MSLTELVEELFMAACRECMGRNGIRRDLRHRRAYELASQALAEFGIWGTVTQHGNGN